MQTREGFMHFTMQQLIFCTLERLITTYLMKCAKH